SLDGPASAVYRLEGHKWYTTDRRGRLLQSPDGEFWIRPVVEQSEVARYEMLLEPLATNTLFGPHRVRSVIGRLQGVEYDAEDSIYLRVPTARRTQYQVIYELPKQKL